jgi:gliding motility-associated-like protein
MITVYPIPTASFTCPIHQSIYDPLIQFSDYSLGATSWLWNFGDAYCPPANNTSNIQSPSHPYSALGTYCVLLTVSNGYCIDTAQLCLVIEPEFIFYIPDAFSPNSDGVNDDFYGKGEGINSYEMWIYDRWGNQVFYGDAINKHWDGSMAGRIVQEDVYVYVVKLYDWQNQEHKYIGTVTVVK